MSRKLFLAAITFSLILAACAPAVQDQRSLETHPSNSTPHPAAPSGSESTEPTSSKTPELTLDRPGTFETSVLVSEWDERAREHRLYLLDPRSGYLLPDYPPISLGAHYRHAFSPDRRTLAIATPGSLRLIDLPDWKERVYELQLGSSIGGMAFDPEGRRLAIIFGNRESNVTVFDLDQEAVITQNSLDFLASSLKFTADSRGLMIYGKQIKNRFTASEVTAGPPKVALLDAVDLSLRWSMDLEGVRDGIYRKDETLGETVDLHQPGAAIYLYPGLAFAPDRDALYVVHPDQDKLTTVDFDAQKVMTVEFHTPLTWFERLLAVTVGSAQAKVAEGTGKQAVVSPDGQSLYVVGQDNQVVQGKNGEWQTKSTPLGLQVIRIADGVHIARFDTQASEISISPDGRFLYLGSWEENTSWTEVIDASRREAVARLDGILRPTIRMNGKPLLISSVWIGDGTGYRMAAVDPRSLDVLAVWTGPQYLAWLSAP